ncbi:MAG: dihydrofolate synthase [Thermoleophilia bacterium]|nr:dihydrofolate synthase [Thermoleophilia bacterium]
MPEELGLERMRALLAELGEPQRAFRAIHVVGTNGKSTTTRMAAALLRGEGLVAGAYTSPHVSSWAERIWVDGAEAEFEQAVARVRPAAEAIGATQFEVLTAAALTEFAERGVEAAVVEAGLGGRLDATNVLDAPVVVLTNVSLEHTDVLGDTREAIADEKLAVVRPGATVVLGQGEWEPKARDRDAAIVTVVAGSSLALAHAAVEAFLERRVDPTPAERVQLAGRLERRGDAPLEIWDGAHTLAGAGWLLPRIPTRRYVLMVSMLADKDVERFLAALSPLGGTLVATSSSNPRALPADELARAAAGRFGTVEIVPDPPAAVARARELAGPDGAVLVTGSLYLLADLYARPRT